MKNKNFFVKIFGIISVLFVSSVLGNFSFADGAGPLRNITGSGNEIVGETFSGYTEGPVIFVDQGDLVIKNSEFSDNVNTNSSISGLSGGAIYLDGKVTIENSKFFNNSASYGGAIYIGGNSVLTFKGNNYFAGNKDLSGVNDIVGRKTGTNNPKIIVESGTTNITGGISGGVFPGHTEIYYGGELVVKKDAVLNINTSKVYENALTLDGVMQVSILDHSHFGQIFISDSHTIDSDATLKLDINIDKTGEGVYQIFNFDVGDINLNFNQDLYNVTNIGDGKFDITINPNAPTPPGPPAPPTSPTDGLSDDAAEFVDSTSGSTDSALVDLNNQIQDQIAAGNLQGAELLVKKANPEKRPVTRGVMSAIQNQIFALASERMNFNTTCHYDLYENNEIGYRLWTHVLFNEFKSIDEFKGFNRGFSVGADFLLNEKFMLGAGYLYNFMDVLVNDIRDADIYANSAFIYSQYQPTAWYINSILSYTKSNHKENIDFPSYSLHYKRDADSLGAGLMTGYKFFFGLTPEAGLRYIHAMQDKHSNGLLTFDYDDMDILTGVAGLKYGITLGRVGKFAFTPEIRASGLYDLVSDNVKVKVTGNGITPYTVETEDFSRWGGEFEGKLRLEYNCFEMSFNYILDLYKDFTSQTGMVKFRYSF